MILHTFIIWAKKLNFWSECFNLALGRSFNVSVSNEDDERWIGRWTESLPFQQQCLHGGSCCPPVQQQHQPSPLQQQHCSGAAHNPCGQSQQQQQQQQLIVIHQQQHGSGGNGGRDRTDRSPLLSFSEVTNTLLNQHGIGNNKNNSLYN